MNIKRVLTILAFASCLLPLAAEAAAPDYDYLQFSYASINDPSGSGISSDHGYGLSGSYDFTGNWFVGAGYSHETADGPLGTSLTGNLYDLGIGYHYPLNSNWDLVPSLTYLSSKVEASAPGAGTFFSETDTGWDEGLGMRGMVTEQLELDAGLDHSSAGSSSNSVSVAALYNFTHSIAAGVGYASARANGQDTSSWQVAFRYYFR